MKTMVQIRLKDDGIQTLSRIYVYDGLKPVLELVGLEPTWKENQRNVSCIPAGTYRVEKRFSTRHREHYHILGVEERDLILFHRGNFYWQTQGCTLVGNDFTDINNDGLLDVTQSVNTMNALLSTMGDAFHLVITGVIHVKD